MMLFNLMSNYYSNKQLTGKGVEVGTVGEGKMFEANAVRKLKRKMYRWENSTKFIFRNVHQMNML